MEALGNSIVSLAALVIFRTVSIERFMCTLVQLPSSPVYSSTFRMILMMSGSLCFRICRGTFGLVLKEYDPYPALLCWPVIEVHVKGSHSPSLIASCQIPFVLRGLMITGKPIDFGLNSQRWMLLLFLRCLHSNGWKHKCTHYHRRVFTVQLATSPLAQAHMYFRGHFYARAAAPQAGSTHGLVQNLVLGLEAYREA